MNQLIISIPAIKKFFISIWDWFYTNTINLWNKSPKFFISSLITCTLITIELIMDLPEWWEEIILFIKTHKQKK